MKPHLLWKTCLTLIATALTITSCQKPPPAESRTAEKITVAFTFQPQSTLVHIAAAKGYFAENGLDIVPLMHTYGKAALQAVLDNQADFATVAETPVMFNVLKGEKIFVLANIESSTQNDAIVARKDAGISVPGDLKGKRIGVTPGTSGDFFLDTFLTANGMKRDAIHSVPLKPEEMQAAIMAKKVDAVSTWNYPLTEIKRQLGAGGTSFHDRQIYTETFNLAARQDFVQKNPETVKRFLRALIMAENFVIQHQEEAQSIMSDRTRVDLSIIREVWDAFSYHVKLDHTLLITLEDETRWAMRNKLTDKTDMPDYLSFIHQDSLRAVKPEAIKMKH